MKKLIIALFLLFTINANSQIQRYFSYTQYYTEANYTEVFHDTCKIVIEDNSVLRLLVISGKNLMEFIPIYDFRNEYINQLGIKSLIYNINDKDIKKIEFVYQDSKLSMVIITRATKISGFVIYPKIEWL